MKTFEDWVLYVFGGFTAIGMVVTARITKVQDEHSETLTEHAAQIAAHAATAANTTQALERIESKLDRVIERGLPKGE